MDTVMLIVDRSVIAERDYLRGEVNDMAAEIHTLQKALDEEAAVIADRDREIEEQQDIINRLKSMVQFYQERDRANQASLANAERTAKLAVHCLEVIAVRSVGIEEKVQAAVAEVKQLRLARATAERRAEDMAALYNRMSAEYHAAVAELDDRMRAERVGHANLHPR